ncbi:MULTISPECIES: DUF4350 domain-containing protein [Bacillaceae]|uniref:DUF4350 domain-containing protein n=1 Tax=Evansella alkalicola TaxID=745819 RepID=A0ABS6JZ60_9BACI|nr:MULTISPECIES: DUF4350 domain-containing protein [Bacillaceae]MBU9722370.1 DUF4350 domain-containing protein [Bacillus alkalicola]
MKGKLINRWTWIWVLILLLFILGNYISHSNQPQEYPAYVSQSPSQSGTKAIYTYLENEYGNVTRWENEPFLLQGESDLLLMVEPFFVPPEQEMASYMDYINAGNTILLFSNNPVGMFDVKVEYSGLSQEEAELESIDGSQYQATLYSDVRIQLEAEDEVLLQDEYGAIAVKRPLGDGSLIISNTPEWLMNDVILDYDHVPLILELLSTGLEDGGQIIFDEYIHGATPSITTLYPKSFLVLLLQGAFVTLLWLWYRGKRFGPILQAREETVRFSDERITALAAWYLRLREKGLTDSLNTQAQYIKMLLQEHWRIPTHTEWLDMKEQLERKWTTVPKSEIEPFLIGLENVLRKESISKQEYLLWSKKLEQLRKGVEEG